MGALKGEAGDAFPLEMVPRRYNSSTMSSRAASANG
jgi:hypothetical protein